MNTHLRSRHAAVAAAGGILAALSIGGVALAITDTQFKYTSPKTGFYTVGSASFAPKDTTSAGNYFNSVTGGLGVLDQRRCFLTGVNLPHGAALTGLRVWYVSGA